MMCKQVVIKLKSAPFRIFIKRTLKSSIAGPYTEDSIVVQAGSQRYIFRGFSELFRFLELRFEKKALLEVYESLGRLNLCVRCGYCCTTGAPPITLNDSKRLVQEKLVRETLENIIRRALSIDISISSPEVLFVVWNSLLDFLRPCPFLLVLDNVTSCTIYDIKPKFCSIFKCWLPDIDTVRVSHIRTVLKELEVIRHSASCGSSVAKLIEAAKSKLYAMLSYFEFRA